MKTTRRRFLETAAFGTVAGLSPKPAGLAETRTNVPLDASEIAKRHAIEREIPSPNFFEGMLLGNGDVGVCAVVRPDALGLHLGKSDVWDIRVDEEGARHVLPFPELLKLWERASAEAKRLGKPDMLFLESNISFFKEYTDKVAASYDQRVWPRPWPCGTVWIHWDPRWVHVARQTLDPSNGLFTLELHCNQRESSPVKRIVSSFVDWDTGLLSVSTDGPVSFSSVDYYPELDRSGFLSVSPRTEKEPWGLLPAPEVDGRALEHFAEFSCRQHLPATAPTEQMPNPPRSEKDRNFALAARVSGAWTLEGLKGNQDRLARRGEEGKNAHTHYPNQPGIYLHSRGEQPFRLDLKMATPRDLLLEKLENQAAMSGEKNPWLILSQNRSYQAECTETLPRARQTAARLSGLAVSQIQRNSEANWRKFWSRSAVELEDKDLESIWFRNQYFLACCVRERHTAPGLFGNWMTGRIGTAWHSDYHLDYNEQQIYWGVFSSNHVEQHLPYVEICANLLGMCENFAREKMEYPGAFYPVSAYPAPSQVIPYPTPPWGYQVSMTPWTVQSLWWQYLYTQDDDYLRHIYPMLRSAARFLAAYVRKGEDGKYHIVPTVSSENWGFTVDYRLNKDCILDLALTEFLLDAVIEASSILNTDVQERSRWEEVRENLASYPKANGPNGEIWVDVLNAPADHIYNVPLTLAPVFPAEQVGLGKGEDQLEIARRTARTVRLEGGNDLVFQPLIRARLGILNLRWFKRQVEYCLLPNGAAGDRVRQAGGRYNDSTDFDFMMHMGVWTENLALPAVLNECLIQSYTGTIRLFPNRSRLGRARFENLRAVGAFLVSASWDGRRVYDVSLVSEKGKAVRLANPWRLQQAHIIRLRDGENIPVQDENGIFVFNTHPGESYRIEPA